MKTQLQTYTMHSLLAEIALLKDEQALTEWKAKSQARCAALLPREQTAIRIALVRRRTLFVSLRQSDQRTARAIGKRYTLPVGRE